MLAASQFTAVLQVNFAKAKVSLSCPATQPLSYEDKPDSEAFVECEIA